MPIIKSQKIRSNESVGGLQHIAENDCSFQPDESVCNTISEQDIWKGLLDGDRRSLADLFLKYRSLLLSLGKSIGVDKDICDDIIQEVYFYLWTHREKLPKVNSVKYYLVVCFRNAVYASYKKDAERRKMNEKIYLQTETHTLLTLDEIDEYEHGQQINRMFAFIEKLPRRQAQAIRYRYSHNKSYEEVAALMNISVHSVRKLVCAGIAHLRENCR
ncbi:MAG: sigma-70 family RNA polymerase sigma factor [Cyclobacteriaceae bacterium]|nr:sigma-70 family RNA polymerase sigma factor [Cyclobacteriaceae bacterium]